MLVKYNVEPYIIDELELPDTPDAWQIVGDLEFEYADEFGYASGTHYAEMRRLARLMTVEKLSANGRQFGPIGGRISKSNIEACRKGGQAGSRNAILSGKHAAFKKVKCPHCDMICNPGGMAIHIRAKHSSDI